MPNHVKNVLRISGSEKEIDTLMNFVSDDESPFSFDKILPMPPENEMSDEYQSDPMPRWWYWRNANWNTKWDAYDVEVIRETENNLCYTFYTAWSPPIPVLLVLSEIFKTLEFDYEYADEDLGYNLGDAIIKDGEFLREECPKEGSNEAFEKAIKLWDIQDQYQLVDGEYVYAEPLGLN